MTRVTRFARSFYRELKSSRPELVSAAISFYVIFSLGPVLFITIRVLSFFLGERAVEGEIVRQTQHLVGAAPAQVMQDIIASAIARPSSNIATIISIPLVILGGTMIFFQLKNALHFIWDLEHHRRRGILGLLIEYLYTIPKISIVGLFFFLLIQKSSVLTLFRVLLQDNSAHAGLVIQVLDFTATFVIITMLFAVIYRVVPNVNIGWTDLWVGAGATSLLFTLGQVLIGLYIATTDVGSAYGAIGSITILFIWIYYSSLAFLLGAVFTKVYARRRGSLRQTATFRSI